MEWQDNMARLSQNQNDDTCPELAGFSLEKELLFYDRGSLSYFLESVSGVSHSSAHRITDKTEVWNLWMW
jgi:hypothetical protein